MGLGEIVNGLLTSRERLIWEASLARNARDYMKRADLAREGERPVALRIILAGWAQKYKQMPDGRRQILGLVLPGELCDLDLFTVARTDHSIAAVRRLSVAEISRPDAQRLFEQCPNLAPALCWAAIIGAAGGLGVVQRDLSTSGRTGDAGRKGADAVLAGPRRSGPADRRRAFVGDLTGIVSQSCRFPYRGGEVGP